MKKRMSIVAALVFVLAFCFITIAGASPVDNMKFFTEDYPPFNMMGADGKLTGVGVETLVEIFKRCESKHTLDDIKLVPWARGYKDLQEDPTVCLFSMGQTEERLPNFKWVGPFFVNTFDAFALKSRGIKVNSKEDLVNLKAGVIRDDIGENLAKAANIKHIESTATTESNVKKLQEGRIDIWVFSQNGLKLQLDKMKLNVDDFEKVWQLSESRLFYAFNKDADDAVISAMQKALDEMKADGTHAAILAKYDM